jgi:hypothetical protein
VVIEPVQDLHVQAVGQGPVGDVALPAFVGLLGGEADVAGLGALVRLRADEPAGAQDPPDRRHRGCASVPGAQVRGDGRSAGFVPVFVEVLADLDDLVLDITRGPGGLAMRASGSRSKPGLALREISLYQGDDPPARDAIVAGDLALTASLYQHRRDDQLRQPHRSPLGSGVNDVPRQV